MTAEWHAITAALVQVQDGGSRAESPDKRAPRVHVPAGEERLELVEVPLFAMRAERSAWDAQAHRRFLQSTRR